MKKKHICLLTALMTMTGCTQSAESTASVIPEKEPEIWHYAGEETTRALVREETVTVSADASGNAYKTESEVLLKNIPDDNIILEKTRLKDIRNRTGDEEFELNGEDLYWQNHGSEITYEGSCNEPLPVTVHFVYSLDGKQIAPEQLAGKNGHLQITVSTENHTDVPFTAVTMILPGENTCTNVTADNCSVIEFSGQTIFAGITFPGLTELLELKDNADIEILETFTIEADVTDFAMDFTTTMITNGILKELDTKDIDKLTDTLDDMEQGKEDIRKAADELSDGVNEYAGYLDQYFDGVTKINEGMQALNSGIRTLDDNSDALRSGTSDLHKGIETLQQAAGQYIPKEEDRKKIEEVLKTLDQLAEQIRPYAEKLSENMPDIRSKADEIIQMLNDPDTLSQKEQELTQLAQQQAENALTEALKDTEISEEEKQQLTAQVKNNINLNGKLQDLYSRILVQLEDLKQQFPALKDVSPSGILDEMQKKTDELEQFLNTYDSSRIISLLDQIDQAYDGISQLESGSQALAQGIQAYTDGVSKMSEGTQQLADGTEQLKNSSSALKTGMNAIKDGTGEFSDALREFADDQSFDMMGMNTEDIRSLADRINILKKNDISYTTYSGIDVPEDSSVRFMIETDEIR